MLTADGLAEIERQPEFEVAQPELRSRIHWRRQLIQIERDHAAGRGMGIPPPADRLSRFDNSWYTPTLEDLMLADRENFGQTPIFMADDGSIRAGWIA